MENLMGYSKKNTIFDIQSKNQRKTITRMEGYLRDEKNEQAEKEEIFSKAVRAGKRTYFFDVRATRKNDFYLTITESKKRIEQDGRFFFEKHKIFLYKEDFDKFADGLQEVVDYIRSAQLEDNENEEVLDEAMSVYSDVDFDDLSK